MLPDRAKVADHVQDLVADDLVLEPQVVVDKPLVIDHQRTVQRPAFDLALSTDLFHVLQEAESPCRSNLPDESLRGDGKAGGPNSDGGVVVVDFESDLERVGGDDRELETIFEQPDRFAESDDIARAVLAFQARFQENIDKGFGTPVPNGKLVSFDLHDDIVDSETANRAQGVFHGIDSFLAMPESGLADRVFDHDIVRIDFHPGFAGKVGADENVTVIGGCGFEGDGGGVPGVNSNP